MTVNNEQNISTNRLVTVGKFVVLSIIVFVGLACIFLYFHLYYMPIALLAIFALAISVVLFAKQTRFKIYSLPALITSLLFIASSSIMAYGDYGGFVSANTKLPLKMAGVGLFMMGVGLAMATTSVAMSSMNKLDFWKSEYAIEFKYPKYSLIMVFISGTFMILSGTFMTVVGLHVVNSL